MFYSYYNDPMYYYAQNEPVSYIRLLHASPSAPAVDVYANDILIARNLAYRGFTAYLNIRPGEYRVTVYPTGTRASVVIDTRVTVAPRSIYTIAAIGTQPNLSLLAMAEPKMTIPQGKAMVRFVHLSPDAPAVDITLPDGTQLFRNVIYKQITNYIPVTPTTYTLQARVAGTANVVLHVPNVRLYANRFYTVYAIGLAQGQPGLQVLIPLDGNTYLNV